MNKYCHWLYNPHGLYSAIQYEVGHPCSVAMETDGLMPTAGHGNHQERIGGFVHAEQETLDQLEGSWAIKVVNILWKGLRIMPLVRL